MFKRSYPFLLVLALLCATATVAQQYPVLDKVADRVVQKYQSSSCEQLWQQRSQKQGQPKPKAEQEVLQLLKTDPQMRQAFLAKVAAPIANKLFECGMIP